MNTYDKHIYDYLALRCSMYQKRMKKIIDSAIQSNTFDGIPLNTTVLDVEYPSTFSLNYEESLSEVLYNFDLRYVQLESPNYKGTFFLRDDELVYIVILPSAQKMQADFYHILPNLLLAAFNRPDLIPKNEHVHVAALLDLYLS